jgi:hypothetical protein
MRDLATDAMEDARDRGFRVEGTVAEAVAAETEGVAGGRGAGGGLARPGGRKPGRPGIPCHIEDEENE